VVKKLDSGEVICMIREIDTGSDESTLDAAITNGLGELRFYHPAGTFAITPASSILLRAIAENQQLLHGVGIDWGTGVGCQAILAAKIPAVDFVYGLEISKENVQTAIQNAEANQVGGKTRFILSDSYQPMGEEDARTVDALKGKVDFVLSNPPSSDWDDGFGFRRMVLAGAREFLKPGGVVLMNVSFQYGMERIRQMTESLGCFRYLGVAATTQSVPFDLNRPDLLDCLKTYVKEEKNGGMDYAFLRGGADERDVFNARTALEEFEQTGKSPLTKWQTQLFLFVG